MASRESAAGGFASHGIIQAISSLDVCEGEHAASSENLAWSSVCMCWEKIYFNLLCVVHGLLHGWHCIAWAVMGDLPVGQPHAG